MTMKLLRRIAQSVPKVLAWMVHGVLALSLLVLAVLVTDRTWQSRIQSSNQSWPERWRSIELGTTETVVRSLLGNPDERNDVAPCWIYHNMQMNCQSGFLVVDLLILGRLETHWSDHIVVFSGDGKVRSTRIGTSYERIIR